MTIFYLQMKQNTPNLRTNFKPLYSYVSYTCISYFSKPMVQTKQTTTKVKESNNIIFRE